MFISDGQIDRTPMTEGTNARDHNPHGFYKRLASAERRTIGAHDWPRPAKPIDDTSGRVALKTTGERLH